MQKSHPVPNPLLIVSLILSSFIFLAQCSSQRENNNTTYSNDSFDIFVDSLTNAIETNDTTFIFSHTDSAMFNGFGHNSGKEAFKQIWNAPNEPIDDELMTALTLGAAYDSTTQQVYAPYHFVTFPDSLDAFRYVFILDDNVPVYNQPDSTKSPKRTLSKGLVEVTSWGASADTAPNGEPIWADIKLDNGESAVIQRRYLRSPIDYRFWFEKKNGIWFLMGWAAGD